MTLSLLRRVVAMEVGIMISRTRVQSRRLPDQAAGHIWTLFCARLDPKGVVIELAVERPGMERERPGMERPGMGSSADLRDLVV